MSAFRWILVNKTCLHTSLHNIWQSHRNINMSSGHQSATCSLDTKLLGFLVFRGHQVCPSGQSVTYYLPLIHLITLFSWILTCVSVRFVHTFSPVLPTLYTSWLFWLSPWFLHHLIRLHNSLAIVFQPFITNVPHFLLCDFLFSKSTTFQPLCTAICSCSTWYTTSCAPSMTWHPAPLPFWLNWYAFHFFTCQIASRLSSI